MEKRIILGTSQYFLNRDGIIWGDMNTGVEKYLTIIKDEMTYQEVEQAYKKHNINKVLEKVWSEFNIYYKTNIPHIEMINCYKNGICISVYTQNNNSSIYVDELFEYSIMSFLIICFLWDEFGYDIEVWEFCFENMVALFHNQCIYGETPLEIRSENMIKLAFEKDSHLLDLMADCYWSILAFCISHELAHIYFKQNNEFRILKNGKKDQTLKQKRKEEFAADRMGYDLLIYMIKKELNLPESERLFYEFTIFSPIILMEFFDLYYYTDRVLYGRRVDDKVHPSPQKRKNQLFGVLYNSDIDVKVEDGEQVYNAILDATDKNYKDNLLLKKQRGKFDGFLR